MCLLYCPPWLEDTAAIVAETGNAPNAMGLASTPKSTQRSRSARFAVARAFVDRAVVPEYLEVIREG